MIWCVSAIALRKMGEVPLFETRELGGNQNAGKPSTSTRTYNGEAHGERPKASQGVALDRLPDAHLMLAVLFTVGIIQEVLVDQDIGFTGSLLIDLDLFQLRLCPGDT